MAVQDIREALVIRERDLFLITNVAGEVPLHNLDGYGFYYADTRYLSGYEFSFADAKPVVLLSTAELGYSAEQVLTNPTMRSLEGRNLPRGTVEVRRQRVLEEVLEETLRITNYNLFPITLDVIYTFDADFADIFEIRGYHRTKRGRLFDPLVRDTSITFSYKGLDGKKREALINFSPSPLAIDGDSSRGSRARFRISLGHRDSSAIRIVISPDKRLGSVQGGERLGSVATEYSRWLSETTRVYTDNEFFNAVLQRSLTDLRMLWKNDGYGGAYPAAGTPWFDTLFGRDTCIVGLQTLAYKPELARQGLKVLARWQGKKSDPWRDEEPGKILHELRQDELTRISELPFSPYYGSVDATALFLWLAAEYYAWTNDLELIREIEPNLKAAIRWLYSYGDLDGDGYLEYEKRSAKGLVNQGWKDSGDAIMHADGTLVEAPVALVEVQGYLYAAKKGLAPLFDALGDPISAQIHRNAAAVLKRRFNRDFWLPEGYYALALDGQKGPAASSASNPGHALWAGIVLRSRAAQITERLLRNDMFSGWGIRTLSTTSSRFNPFGYHLGTVWPHDNSIIAMGFKKYGFEDEVNEVATALFDAARAFPYYRLPELFGGAARSAHHAPVPYPVACRPQAWAAGAFPFILQAILGLRADAPAKRLFIVRPKLPQWLGHVQLEGLRVGQAEVDLYYERKGDRTSVQILDVRGDLQVEIVRRWPL